MPKLLTTLNNPVYITYTQFPVRRYAVRATVLDLRYRMKEVLQALEKGEKVSVFYHGKLKGTIIPAGPDSALRVEDHPFFGMAADEARSVSDQMDDLRRGRVDAF
jgi:antitoxin (DNA-binding transcriptional repressor) of toxin-antitoxin stability system